MPLIFYLFRFLFQMSLLGFGLESFLKKSYILLLILNLVVDFTVFLRKLSEKELHFVVDFTVLQLKAFHEEVEIGSRPP